MDRDLRTKLAQSVAETDQHWASMTTIVGLMIDEMDVAMWDRFIADVVLAANNDPAAQARLVSKEKVRWLMFQLSLTALFDVIDRLGQRNAEESEP